MSQDRTAALDFVRFARKIGAITLHPHGRKLKNKRISPYFVNTGVFDTASRLKVLGSAYAEAVGRIGDVDVIYGPPYKAIPLCVATSLAFFEMQVRDVGWAFHRKEAKDHAEKGIFVGHPLPGLRVCLVDDVITDGETKEEAARFIESAEGKVVGLVIGFDRQERARDDGRSALQDFSAQHNIPVEAAANLQDLIRVLEEEDTEEVHHTLPLIHQYIRQYGAL